MKSFFLLLLLLGSMAACKPHRDMPAAKTPFVTLETTGCRGFCPIYKLSFMEDGSLLYHGIRFVQDTGAIQSGITKEELALLKLRVAEANVWQYPEFIKSQVADAPGGIIEVFDGSKSHRVSGSMDRPKPLLELENTMKALAEAHGFRIRMGVDPNMQPPGNEVIIKLKPDVNAGNWIMQVQEVKIQLVRRLSAENMWLVNYNPLQINEKALIHLLKQDPNVLEVQPNKPTQDRN